MITPRNEMGVVVLLAQEASRADPMTGVGLFLCNSSRFSNNSKLGG